MESLEDVFWDSLDSYPSNFLTESRLLIDDFYLTVSPVLSPGRLWLFYVFLRCLPVLSWYSPSTCLLLFMLFLSRVRGEWRLRVGLAGLLARMFMESLLKYGVRLYTLS